MIWTTDQKVIRKPSEIFISMWPRKGKPYATVVASNADLYAYIRDFIEENGTNIGTFKILVSSTKVEVLTQGLKKKFGDLDFKVVAHKIHEAIHFLPTQKKLIIDRLNKIEKERENPKPEVTNRATKKVMLVDDSPTILKLLEKLIEQNEEFEVCSKVSDPRLVLSEIERCKPDVITLDMHMPNLNGIQVIEQVLPKHKIPIVLVTSLSLEEGPLVFRALEKGAVDYLRKPSGGQLEKSKDQLISKLKIAVKAQLIDRSYKAPAVRFTDSMENLNLICIGASTGGTTALMQLMAQLPRECPPIVIIQHIPKGFSNSFATNLDRVSSLRVIEAEDGMSLQNGCCYVAPGGYQLKLLPAGDGYKLNVNEDAPVNRFQPSVDYFFESVARCFKSKGVGIVMTGMGRDGAKGLLSLRNKGFMTLAQDEASSVVFGMPKEAGNLGAVEEFVSLDKFPRKLSELALLVKRKKRAS